MTIRANDVESAQECLFRFQDFRRWLNTNPVFPVVDDSIVNPLRKLLMEGEHLLVNFLYDNQQIDKAVVVDNVLKPKK